jgi:predicted alpha/beta hydrolase family esterase
MATTLIIPGLGNSGPDHWQSWWQAVETGSIRVLQQDWTTPDLLRWATAVEEAIQGATVPVWIVAHSFGSLAAVVAASRNPRAVAGVFLVAPADPQNFDVEPLLPEAALQFPSAIVASSNDPWLKLMTAGLWAQRWDSRLINVGAAGHINAESGFGPWVEGRMLFTAFKRSLEDWPQGDIPADLLDVASAEIAQSVQRQ